MSIKLMTQVMESNLPPLSRYVALICADFARDDGTQIFPSVATIVRKTGLGSRTVQRQLRLLESSKILSVAKRSPGRPTEYRLNPAMLMVCQTDMGGYATQTGGGVSVTGGGSTQTGGGVSVTPYPLINHQSTTREPGRSDLPGSEQLNPMADHSWQVFRELMPLRNGKFLDEDACREKWARSPAKWNQWIAAVRNYRKSNEVRDGAVCSPMTFIAKKWRDWEQPEDGQGVPLGAGGSTGSPQAPQHGPHDRSWREQAIKDEEIARQGKGRPGKVSG